MPTDIEMPEDGQPSPEPQLENPAPPVAEPEVEAPPEFLPYRRPDGSELQLPGAESEAVARALGYDNAASLVNQLRNGEDAQQLYREAREYYRRANRPQRSDAEYQGMEQNRQRQHQPQRPQYQPPPQEDDPLQILRDIREENQALRSEWQEWRAEVQRKEVAEYQKNAANLMRVVDTEYKSFVSELKAKGFTEERIPDKELLLEQAEDMGMFNSNLPIPEIYRRVHRMNNSEAYAQNAVAKQMQKMRDPKARMAVPAAQAPAQAAPKQGSDIDNIPWSEVLKNLPEGKF